MRPAKLGGESAATFLTPVDMHGHMMPAHRLAVTGLVQALAVAGVRRALLHAGSAMHTDDVLRGIMFEVMSSNGCGGALRVRLQAVVDDEPVLCATSSDEAFDRWSQHCIAYACRWQHRAQDVQQCILPVAFFAAGCDADVFDTLDAQCPDSPAAQAERAFGVLDACNSGSESSDSSVSSDSSEDADEDDADLRWEDVEAAYDAWSPDSDDQLGMLAKHALHCVRAAL